MSARADGPLRAGAVGTQSAQPPAHVYAVTFGCYSDYTVDCIFEREEDAVAYLRALGKEVYRSGEALDWELWREKDSYGWRVEGFQFWAAGEVPHAHDEDAA